MDQGKAQLYYTFAANGNDKSAQMALGYRYWSGIGTLESCERAVAWYGNAAEQGIRKLLFFDSLLIYFLQPAMAKFLSGPPGGRTLSLTPTRLSDLAGGIYGPGASVASTGLNTQRPAIKAGVARAAGETWIDVLEYYQVTKRRTITFHMLMLASSMRIGASLILRIDLGKYFIKGVFMLVQAV